MVNSLQIPLLWTNAQQQPFNSIEGNNRQLIVTVGGMWNATMSASGEWVTSKHWVRSVCLCVDIGAALTLPKLFTQWYFAIATIFIAVLWHYTWTKSQIDVWLRMKFLFKILLAASKKVDTLKWLQENHPPRTTGLQLLIKYIVWNFYTQYNYAVKITLARRNIEL